MASENSLKKTKMKHEKAKIVLFMIQRKFRLNRNFYNKHVASLNRYNTNKIYVVYTRFSMSVATSNLSKKQISFWYSLVFWKFSNFEDNILLLPEVSKKTVTFIGALLRKFETQSSPRLINFSIHDDTLEKMRLYLCILSNFSEIHNS